MSHRNQHLFPTFDPAHPVPQPAQSDWWQILQILGGLALVVAWLALLGGLTWLCVEMWKLTGL